MSTPSRHSEPSLPPLSLDPEPISGLLKVDRAGRGQVVGDDLRRQLCHLAGYYELSEKSSPERLIFERAHEAPPQHNELREPIVFQGDIGGIGSTIDVISFVLNSRLTGQLTCVQGPLRISLFFKEGELCAARSNHADDQLREVLYRFGALEREPLEVAEREAKRLKRPLGNHLVSEGLLNQGQLYLYFKKQVEEIFYSALLLAYGEFYFTTPHLQEHPSPLQLSTQQLLLDGVSRADDMRRFRSKVPSKSCLIARIETAPEARDPESRATLELLREPMSVREMIEHFKIGEYRLYQRIFNLIEDGFASVISNEEEQERQLTVGELVAFYNGAFQLLNTYALEAGHPHTLRGGLTAFMQFYGFSHLFEGVRFNDAGQLNQDTLLENLRALDRGEPLFFLGQALSELLYFQLFGARPWLDEEQHTKLQLIYEELTRSVS